MAAVPPMPPEPAKPAGKGALAAPQKKKLAIGGGIAAVVVVVLYLRSKSSSTASTSATTPTTTMPTPSYGYGGYGGQNTASELASINDGLATLQGDFASLGTPPVSSTTPTSIPTSVPDQVAPSPETVAPAAAGSSIVTVPGEVPGTPLTPAEAAASGVSSSGYSGEPVGWSASQNTEQNQLAQALYAGPTSGPAYEANLAAYNKSIGAA